MSWTLCLFVLLEERIRFLPNNWIVRGYWLVELFFNLTLVPAYVAGLYRETPQTIVLWAISLALQMGIFLMTMIKQQARFYRPMPTGQKFVREPATDEETNDILRPASPTSEEVVTGEEHHQHQLAATSAAMPGSIQVRPLSVHAATLHTPLLPSTSTTGSEGGMDPMTVRKRAADDVNFFSLITFHFIRRVLRLRDNYKARPMIELGDLAPLAAED
jgi:hypothetical protein